MQSVKTSTLGPPYPVADDIDREGRIWDFVGDPDALIEEELVDIINSPNYPLQTPFTEMLWSDYGRPLTREEPVLDATHAIGSLRGLRLIWQIDAEGGEKVFRTIFPVATFSESFAFKIDRIETSADGAQARVSGGLIGFEGAVAALSFFLTDWYETRQLILPGETHHFGIGIWAMAIKPAQPFQWEIATSEWIKNKPAEVLKEMGDLLENPSITIIGDEMRTVYGPAYENGAPDIVYFRGQVRSRRKLRALMMGWAMWDVLVELLDLQGHPVLMKIVVTDAVLGDANAPKRGDWVEGHGWMQGNLVALNACPEGDH